MALFSELAQAMNLVYGINDNKDENKSSQEHNDSFVVSDYNTFSQGLSDPLPHPSSSEPSDNEDDIDLVVNRSYNTQQELNLPAKVTKNLVNDDTKENKEPMPFMQENSDSIETVPTKEADVDPAEPLKEKSKNKKKSPGQKIKDQKDKHPMLHSCSCKKKCIERISEELRKKIHYQFWEHDYNQRLEWLNSKRIPVPIKRRKSDTKSMRERNVSYEYFFLNEDACKEIICQEFFRNTLGFKSHKFLQVLTEKCREGDNPIPDQRGKSAPPHKTSQKDIEDLDAHIMSYDPNISHYRRSHAPKRLYLPNSLSIRKMHDAYKDDGGKLTYEMYRRRVKDKNIAFTKLGNEECEECLEYENHACQDDETIAKEVLYDIILTIEKKKPEMVKRKESVSTKSTSNCNTCFEHEKHLVAAKLCRKEYQKDAELENTDDIKYFSVDLEKVIMLPRFPGVKLVVFTKRIVSYNLTFAPLGTWKDKKGVDTPPVAVTWHEGEGGRSATEIASGYKVFIECNRDVNNFVFWADNCSSQNKNWYLFTLFCILVNSDRLPNLESITMKYFEAGHTFMSADSYHHLVEKAMSEMKNVEDWHDFLNCLNKHGVALEIPSSQFYASPRGLSEKSKRTKDKPYLENIYVAQFSRGSSKIFWKEKMDEKQFRSSEFLIKKIAENLSKTGDNFPQMYPNGSRGVPKARSDDIIDKLCPLMKGIRREFWYNLKTNNDIDKEKRIGEDKVDKRKKH